MRREDAILADIVHAADAIERSLQGRSFADFMADLDIRDATLLCRALKGRHPTVPWTDAIAFRNRIAHAYFAIDWSIV